MNNDPKTCPERIGDGRARVAPPNQQAPLADISDLPSPPERARFHSGLSLSLSDASAIMSSRYCHLVGILGSPSAGKTAALVSLYLLAARAKLAGFEYANSRSVMAFERLARGARRWNNGAMPDEMTGHTQLADTRNPGLMHLRLRRVVNEQAIDLLLPDLPGEWTDSFIDRGPSPRIEFLRACDVFWMFVDGTTIETTKTRGLVEHRLKLLMDRVAQIRAPQTRVPVVLVVTRRDQSNATPAEFRSNLEREASTRSMVFSVVEVASFSATDHVAPGSGIAELLETALSQAPKVGVPRLEVAPRGRHVLRYRSDA
jgi:hypothetical protein